MWNKIIQAMVVLAVSTLAIAGSEQVPGTQLRDASGAFASAYGYSVYPAGTRFVITSIHPANVYSPYLSFFSSKTATATTCSGANAGASDPGIEIFTVSALAGWYQGCFYLDGDTLQYYLAGFKFNLAASPPPAGTLTPSVSAGIEYGLALAADGSVLGWGQNDIGQLGNGQGAYATSPKKVGGLGLLAAVAAGVGFTVALDQSGGVWAWGLNSTGQLGDGTTQSRYVPRKIAGISGSVISVAAGNGHAMALTSTGQVWAWGSVLGTATQIALAPKLVSGLPAIRAIEAGQVHALVLATDGSVWTWGQNDSGQIGDGTFTARTGPVRVLALSGIASISAGTYQNLALDGNGTVWSWGNNVYGTIGIGTLSPRQVTTPVALTGLPRIAKVFSGTETSTAIDTNGGIWMWGSQAYGVNVTAPRSVSELTALGLIEVRSGWYYLIGRDAAGKVWGWGRNEHGYLGNGNTTLQKTAVQVSGFSGAVSLSAQLHSLALTSDGSLWAWGESGNGELGDGTPSMSNLPISVAGLSSIRSIAAGGFHALASSADGKVWGWGNNANYQLGDQTTVPRSTPAQIAGISSVVSVAAGTNHSLALDASGQVWSWGLLDSGQLGRTTNRGLPGTVPGLPAIKAIAAGATHSLAVGTDGSVWAWGSNGSGQVGDGSTTNRSAAVRVASLSNIVSVEAGSSFSLALDSSGAVWAWGSNAFGQLGDGSTVTRLTPVKIAGIASVSAISAGGGHGVAITKDGKLWTWGANRDGQLGRPDAQSATASPAAVADVQGFTAVSAGWNHTLAVRSDGTVWSAGRNFSGALGEGTLAQRNSLALVLNAGGDGLLDLDPVVANTVPVSKLPPLLARAARVGDLSALSLSANLKATATSGFAATGCSPCQVYVAAVLGDGSIFLADEQGGWGMPTAQQMANGTMSAFLRNVQISSQTALFVNILQSVDLSALTGAQILVGYGSDAAEMISAGRYYSILTVPLP